MRAKREIATANMVRTRPEAALRDHDVPWLETPEELADYVAALVNRRHDYGTSVYAMSMAAVAAFRYAAQRIGVTGFQASCADMDVLRRTRGWEKFELRDLMDLLYPQYEEKFAGWEEHLAQNISWLRPEARKRLDAGEHAHPDVMAHWRRLAAWPVVAVNPPRRASQEPGTRNQEPV